MIRTLALVSALALGAAAATAQTAAPQPTPAEKAGAAMKDAAEATKDAAGRAVQATENAAAKAAAATKEAAAGAVDATKNAAAAAEAGAVRLVDGFVAEVDKLASGWPLKRSVIGQSVYNEKMERIGEIDDVVIMPRSGAAYAVVGVGGFLGIGERDVVAPFSSIRIGADNKFVLAGVSKETVGKAPAYTYPKM